MAEVFRSRKFSMMIKYLTPEVYDRLQDLKTSTGVTLEQVIASGRENEDSSIGVYAGDADCYDVFEEIFEPIIEEYHGHGRNAKQYHDFSTANLRVSDLDPTGERIRSTRIRVCRNVAQFGFPGTISRESRLQLEAKIIDALAPLTDDLSGTYFPLADMNEETRQRLRQEHLLFQHGDRFLEAGGFYRDWPEGRGVFHSTDKRFVVWVNEEDQLRLMSMQKGGNLLDVFERLTRALATLERKLVFSSNDHLGYLASCPTNVGTTIRCSFHICLPYISKRPEFRDLCKSFGLQLRGINGEHSLSEGGFYDLSNRRRLGITEAEAVQILYDGTKKIIEMDIAEASKLNKR